MNKLLVGFVVIVMVLVAVPSIAQDDDVKFKFGVKGGWFFWTADELKDSDFDNNWIVGADATAWFDNGLGIGAGVQFLKKTVEYKEFDRETSYRAIL